MTFITDFLLKVVGSIKGRGTESKPGNSIILCLDLFLLLCFLLLLLDNDDLFFLSFEVGLLVLLLPAVVAVLVVAAVKMSTASSGNDKAPLCTTCRIRSPRIP